MRGVVVIRGACAVATVMAALTGVVPRAAAQSGAPSPAPVAAPPAPPPAAPPPAPDPKAAPEEVATLPLRLSFMSAGGSGSPFGRGGCGQESVDSAGTILPVQPHTQVQVTMRLTLVGFSDLGCPGDPYAAFHTGMGGGATYASPLRPDLWLVWSGGAYATRTGSTPATGLDMAWKVGDRAMSAGVGATAPRGRGVRVMARVGGSF